MDLNSTGAMLAKQAVADQAEAERAMMAAPVIGTPLQMQNASTPVGGMNSGINAFNQVINNVAAKPELRLKQEQELAEFNLKEQNRLNLEGYNEGMNALVPQLGAMSPQEQKAATYALAQQYGMNPAQAMESFKSLQDQSTFYGALTDKQNTGFSAAQANVNEVNEYEKRNYQTLEANALAKAGIDQSVFSWDTNKVYAGDKEYDDYVKQVQGDSQFGLGKIFKAFQKKGIANPNKAMLASAVNQGMTDQGWWGEDDKGEFKDVDAIVGRMVDQLHTSKSDLQNVKDALKGDKDLLDKGIKERGQLLTDHEKQLHKNSLLRTVGGQADLEALEWDTIGFGKEAVSTIGVGGNNQNDSNNTGEGSEGNNNNTNNNTEGTVETLTGEKPNETSWWEATPREKEVNRKAREDTEALIASLTAPTTKTFENPNQKEIDALKGAFGYREGLSNEQLQGNQQAFKDFFSNPFDMTTGTQHRKETAILAENLGLSLTDPVLGRNTPEHPFTGEGMLTNAVQLGQDKVGAVDPLWQAESGKYGYDSVAGGDQQNATSMTVGDLLNRKPNVTKDYPQGTSAIGKYQFMLPSFKEVVKDLNISPDTKFTPELQDKMFSHYALKQPAIKAYVTAAKKGIVSPSVKTKAINAFTRKWAGFANESGKGHYDGKNGNKATAGADVVEGILNQLAKGQV